ncbi:MAG: hypothetical protein LBC82_03865 [Oscillospiraceae bacterium]|jgi:hypothetical protein|nr:hypothetical protein [Oscillospiraceae bacterium]
MKKQKPKLIYIFHNPNTEETTMKYISDILAEAAVIMVKKAQEEQIKNETSEFKTIS